MGSRTCAVPVVPITVPTPYTVGPVHAYLIKADPLTLVDCGLGTPGARAALADGLAAAGVRPGDVRRVILTHAHLDHIGNAAWFQELGAEVWVHPLELPKARQEEWYAAAGLDLMRQAGAPAAALETERLMSVNRLFTPLQPGFRLMDDGDPVPFADFDLTVLHTPGHALGHVVLWSEREGILFGGDLLLDGISPNPLPEPLPGGGRGLTLAQFLDSLERISRLPARLAYPGHGPVVREVRGLVAQYLALHSHRLDEVLAALPAGGATAYAMALHFYPQVQDLDRRLALSELLAHLDLLVDRGRAATATGPGDVILYRRAG